MIFPSHRRVGSALEARLMLHQGLPGEFVWHGVARTPGPGEQAFRVE